MHNRKGKGRDKAPFVFFFFNTKYNIHISCSMGFEQCRTSLSFVSLWVCFEYSNIFFPHILFGTSISLFLLNI